MLDTETEYCLQQMRSKKEEKERRAERSRAVAAVATDVTKHLSHACRRQPSCPHKASAAERCTDAPSLSTSTSIPVCTVTSNMEVGVDAGKERLERGYIPISDHAL